MALNTDPHIHKLVICANVFIRRGDEYLVLRRSPLKRFAPGVVHPVGGKVDPDEDPYVAAVREVKEETGLDVGNLRLEAVINEVRPYEEGVNWQIFHFSAEYGGGDVATTDEGELVWLTAEQIKGEKLFDSVRSLIDSMLDPAVGTVFATNVWDDSGRIDDARSITQICTR